MFLEIFEANKTEQTNKTKQTSVWDTQVIAGHENENPENIKEQTNKQKTNRCTGFNQSRNQKNNQHQTKKQKTKPRKLIVLILFNSLDDF